MGLLNTTLNGFGSQIDPEMSVEITQLLAVSWPTSSLSRLLLSSMQGGIP